MVSSIHIVPLQSAWKIRSMYETEYWVPTFIHILTKKLYSQAYSCDKILQNWHSHTEAEFQKKPLIFSFLELESLKAWHYLEGATLSCRKRYILLIFTWARRFLDFLPSMTSLGDYFLRVSYESWIAETQQPKETCQRTCRGPKSIDLTPEPGLEPPAFYL